MPLGVRSLIKDDCHGGQVERNTVGLPNRRCIDGVVNKNGGWDTEGAWEHVEAVLAPLFGGNGNVVPFLVVPFRLPPRVGLCSHRAAAAVPWVTAAAPRATTLLPRGDPLCVPLCGAHPDDGAAGQSALPLLCSFSVHYQTESQPPPRPCSAEERVCGFSGIFPLSCLGCTVPHAHTHTPTRYTHRTPRRPHPHPHPHHTTQAVVLWSVFWLRIVWLTLVCHA